MPEPYLLVKPKADGTATYEWVFLPDRNNEYVVAPKSLFATYKMTVATENGFLTSASFDGTANEVASKLASVVGDVNAANKTSESAAQKAIEQAAQTKAAADETAFNTKLAAAQRQWPMRRLHKQVPRPNLSFTSRTLARAQRTR